MKGGKRVMGRKRAKGEVGEARRGTREDKGSKWEEEEELLTNFLCHFIVLLNNLHWIAKLLSHIVCQCIY